MNHTIHGLRGLCALMVFVGHAVGMAMNAQLISLNDAPWQYFAKLAHAGVNIFFVISGYIIIGSLLKHNRVKNFLKNRFLRIYPVYLVLFCLMAVAGPMIGFEFFKGISAQDYTVTILANLIMLQGGTFGFLSVVPNSWSLGYEFIFYLVACLFFILITNLLKLGDILKWTLIFCTSAGLIIFVATHPRFLYFAVGVAIYFLEKKLRAVQYPIVITMFGGLFFYLLTWINETNLYIAVVLSFPFFVSIIKGEGILSKMLNTNVFKYLGSVSYSFYLWHAFGIFIAKVLVMKFIGVHGMIPAVAFGVTGTVLTVALSHYSYKYIEVKFTNRLRQKPMRTPAIMIKETA